MILWGNGFVVDDPHLGSSGSRPCTDYHFCDCEVAQCGPTATNLMVHPGVPVYVRHAHGMTFCNPYLSHSVSDLPLAHEVFCKEPDQCVGHSLLWSAVRGPRWGPWSAWVSVVREGETTGALMGEKLLLEFCGDLCLPRNTSCSLVGAQAVSNVASPPVEKSNCCSLSMHLKE